MAYDDAPTTKMPALAIDPPNVCPNVRLPGVEKLPTPTEPPACTVRLQKLTAPVGRALAIAATVDDAFLLLNVQSSIHTLVGAFARLMTPFVVELTAVWK